LNEKSQAANKFLEGSKTFFFTLDPRGPVKGKVVPLQAWSGPEGSRKLRFPDFMTAAQDSGKVVSLRTGRLYPAGSTPGTHFC
jgi:hypothetical protein